MLNVVLIGAPGSGKGTQSKMLASQLNLYHLSTGDLLREYKNSDTEIGRKIALKMAAGELIDDETVNAMVSNKISSTKTGFIFDGYPRTASQAIYLDSILPSKIRSVILFDIPDSKIVTRIVNRFTCGSCGSVYNSVLQPLKIDKICDICGSTDFLYRKDDNEEVVNNRLSIFWKNVDPILKYYKDITTRVNADQEPNLILTDILNIVSPSS